MAYKTVNELKAGIRGILQNVPEDSITDFEGAIERAVDIVHEKVYIPDSLALESIDIYDEVYDYPAPQNIFGGSLVDFRPQGLNRNESDAVSKPTLIKFDKTKITLKSGLEVVFEFRNGLPVMRVANSKAKASVVLDNCHDDDWTIGGSASGLVVDETVYYESPSSLRFTLTGSSTGILTKTIDSQDLTYYEDVGVAFLAFRVPSVTGLTSVELKLGSSASAYNNVTATTGFLTSFQGEKWMLVAFDFAGASQTGTPDWSAIDYAQLSIAHTAGLTNVRIGKLFICLPSAYEVLYESTAIFRTTNGVVGTRINSDTDDVLLQGTAYRLLEYQSAWEVQLGLGAGVGQATIETIRSTLNNPEGGLYSSFRAKTPSERIQTSMNYYKPRRIRK